MNELQFRKDLSAPGILNSLRNQLAQIPDHRNPNQIDYSLVDTFMSATAIFSLKLPSLLALDQNRADPRVIHNLKTLFGVKKSPCDTQMREILDEVDPEYLRPAFNQLFALAQRGKALENYVFLDGAFLISLDGTGYFSSSSIHCESCCQKNHRDGSITYHHQMLAPVLIHPNQKQVIPLAPEPIIMQDGVAKNDCERNAAKRLLPKIRKEHPHLKIIIVEDGLASNAPHIRLIRELNMGFILIAKEGDHESLFKRIEVENRLGTVTKFKIIEGEVIHRFRFINRICLNEANPDLFVNFLEYWEISSGKTTHWSWVTHIELTQENACKVMRGGRARWKIENETFNSVPQARKGGRYENLTYGKAT